MVSPSTWACLLLAYIYLWWQRGGVVTQSEVTFRDCSCCVTHISANLGTSDLVLPHCPLLVTCPCINSPVERIRSHSQLPAIWEESFPPLASTVFASSPLIPLSNLSEAPFPRVSVNELRDISLCPRLILIIISSFPSSSSLRRGRCAIIWFPPSFVLLIQFQAKVYSPQCCRVFLNSKQSLMLITHGYDCTISLLFFSCLLQFVVIIILRKYFGTQKIFPHTSSSLKISIIISNEVFLIKV